MVQAVDWEVRTTDVRTIGEIIPEVLGRYELELGVEVEEEEFVAGKMAS